MTFTIPGAPVTKKNSQNIIEIGQKCPVCKRGKRSIPLPSKQYKAYEELAGYYLPNKWAMLDKPLNVKCLYFMPTRRRVDLVNLLEATCDILTHYGVIKDDNSGVVVSHDGSRVLYDKERPRVEITITEASGCSTTI